MCRTKLWLSVSSLVFLACGQPPPEQQGLTYWKDVAPIVSDKCVGCHQTGGIAPMPLDSFEAVKTNATLIADATRTGRMPPFLLTHDGSCGSVEDAETLSAAQIDVLGKWAVSALNEGTVAVVPKPAVKSLGPGLTYQTPSITPVAQGGVLAEEDEYRCFEFDSARTTDGFITGYEVIAGNTAMVHHMLAFVIDPARVTQSGKTNAQLIQALDATDPDRIGWPCFGLAGEGVETDSIPVSWAPGQGPVVYPTGIGAPLRKADKVVIQMHYNLADTRVRGQSDSSLLRLRTVDTVERKAVFVFFDPLLASLGAPQPTIIPPNAASTQLKWKVGVADLGFGQLPYADLVGTLPHMHARGKKMRLDVITSGAPVCASKVDRWDVGWQKFYFYKEPVRLTATSELELMCDYDTSGQSNPTLPGWGSRNEMCLSVLMLALPAGL
jgi:hypothetical protein